MMHSTSESKSYCDDTMVLVVSNLQGMGAQISTTIRRISHNDIVV
jgi:hypothetical protein